MRIVDIFDSVGEVIYTVEINRGVFIDVKRKGDLYYAMQNEDGSEAYDSNGNTFEYHFGGREIVEFVRKELNKGK